MILTDYDLVFIISSIFGAYVLYKFMTVFFGKRKTSKTVEFISYFFYFILSCFMYLLYNIPIVTMIGTLIIFFLISLNYNSAIKKRILALFLIYIILLLLEVLIDILFGFIDFDIYSSNPHFDSIMGLVILKVVSYFVVIFLSKYKNIKKNEKIPITFWFALVFMPIGTIYIIIFLLQTDTLTSSQLIAGISIMLVISIITFALYDSINLMFKSKMESVVLKQQNRHYMQQYHIIEASINKTNSLQHDLKKHFKVLESFIESEEKTRAVSYIKEIVGSLDNKEAIARSGNIPIDSIINFKLGEINKKDINISIDLIIPPKLYISDFDLTVILGNLLDNAIEATEKLADNKYVRIKIAYKKGTLIIKIENSYNGIVSYENNKIVTLHKNKEEHGFGLRNVKNSIEKYNGTMEISHSDQTFVADVLLYGNSDDEM